jgi:hypothetical protein
VLPFDPIALSVYISWEMSMSLDVPTDLLVRAEAGEVPDAAFVDCVRQSLPYAWTVVSRVVGDLESR